MKFVYFEKGNGEIKKVALGEFDPDELGESLIESEGCERYITIEELNEENFNILKELTIGGYIACWEELTNGHKEYHISDKEKFLFNLLLESQ